ncbi:MAG: (Fe-S)-binding protein [Desulfobacter sp.]
MSTDSVNQIMANCGKCGLCLAACPVYQTLKEEQASPRARLQLIKAFEQGTLSSSPLLKEMISKCLMCGSCAAACPSGINHYERFMDMRRKMVQDLGETPAIKSLIFLLSREFRLRAGTRMAALGQRLAPEFIADKYRLGNIRVSRFPRLNTRPFRDGLPEQMLPPPISPDQAGTPSTGTPSKGRLVYFTGCATHYMFADTGNAVTAILTRLGYEVIVPKTQTCCAIPMLFHGAADQAVRNIQTNIRAISAHAFDRVIVDCTTCGAALKDEYPAFIARALEKDGSPDDGAFGPELAEQAAAISQKTTDILGFLAEHDALFDPAAAKNATHLGRAVYHAPCHSRNSFGTHARVQALLKQLPNLDYIPTPGEADCCGGGGTFFYEHPNTAGKIMDKKQEQARAVDPDLWLTDCPVCRINLAGNLDSDTDPQVRVCHPVVPIYKALDPGAAEREEI